MPCGTLRGLFLRPRCACAILAILAVVSWTAFAQNPPTVAPQSSAQQQVPQTPSQSSPTQAGPPEITEGPATSTITTPAEKDAPELSAQDLDATFKVRVNLVEVRVVVRDAKGHSVSGLKKDDFQLLDDGKAQVIQKFAVDDAAAPTSIPHDGEIAKIPATTTPETARPSNPVVSIVPQHYVAYVFDDLHLPFDAIVKARIAAIQHLQNLLPADRAAIYTTSGQGQVDFTDDRAALKDALNRLGPRPITRTVTSECPHMTYYMADAIENRADTQALDAATYDAFECAFQGNTGNPTYGAAAEGMARSAARALLRAGDYDGRVALNALRNVVQRLGIMPGRRTIVLVSPGFLNINQQQDQVRIVERALHSGIVIDTLDARGLYTVGDDAGMKLPPRRPGFRWHDVDSYSVDGMYRHYFELEKSAQANVLMGLAEDTGGTFFHNSNNLLAGFDAGTHEHTYLLAFSPANLKLDGRFHHLKVTVEGRGFDVQARKGYFAPKQAEDAAEQVNREIEEAVFSQQESHDIPVQLHTEFFKVDDDDAKLSVLVRVDARHLHYRKVDGRNRNDVTVVSAVFDRNGKFISGSEKVLQMRLKDETLGGNLVSALTLKTSFDVKTGSYLVRLVVRDDGGQLTAENDAVDIP